MANTAAPLSEVAVANMAAAILSEATITSLDDNTAIARLMSREFGHARDELLQLYPWHFAKTRALLTPNAVRPAFGWQYAYDIPASCVRLIPPTEGGVLGGVPVPHELESRQVLTDYSVNGALPVHFIRRELNMALWSPLAARALGSRLAIIGAVRVTGKAQYRDAAERAYSLDLFAAQHADSLERGSPGTVYSGYESATEVRGV